LPASVADDAFTMKELQRRDPQLALAMQNLEQQGHDPKQLEDARKQLKRGERRHIEEDPQKTGYSAGGRTARMNEEDSFSKAIPSQHRCNSCVAVVYQLDQGFRRAGKRKLRESDLEDIYDDVCKAYGKDHPYWKEYGAREIDGVPALVGPGLLDPAPVRGEIVTATVGGVWSERLQMICFQLVEEVGEQELYDLYVHGGESKGLGTAELCVKRQRFCDATELATLQENIERQKVIDADRKRHSAMGEQGRSGRDRARVTKPLQESVSSSRSSSSGKGSKAARRSTAYSKENVGRPANAGAPRTDEL